MSEIKKVNRYIPYVKGQKGLSPRIYRITFNDDSYLDVSDDSNWVLFEQIDRLRLGVEKDVFKECVWVLVKNLPRVKVES